MDDSTGLPSYQIEVARIFFVLDAATGFVVAGGAALLASDLISRQTEDLDGPIAPRVGTLEFPIPSSLCQ